MIIGLFSIDGDTEWLSRTVTGIYPSTQQRNLEYRADRNCPWRHDPWEEFRTCSSFRLLLTPT